MTPSEVWIAFPLHFFKKGTIGKGERQYFALTDCGTASVSEEDIYYVCLFLPLSVWMCEGESVLAL